MIYNKFNQYIKDKFFPPEKRGDTILFSIDQVILNEFFKSVDTNFCALQISISEILKDNHIQIVENCFGLCAIQVYIANQMKEEFDLSSRQYNPRLAKYLRISNNKLMQIYSKNQELIWYNLKEFCKKNNFQINIPSKKTGKGRYIQYPFSQALLNREDLKKGDIFFEIAGIKKSEYFSFDDFSKLIKAADGKCHINSHYCKVRDRLLKDFGTRLQLDKQIYNYFNYDWDGLYPQKEEKIYINKNPKIYNVHQNIHLFLNKKSSYIIVTDDKYELIAKIDLINESLFNEIEKYQKNYNDDFLIFKMSDQDDQEYVRSFELDEKYAIICKLNSEANKYIYSLCGIENAISNSKYNIFFTNTLKNKSQHFFWKKYFSLQSRNYKVEGGVKLSYKSWMLGCGPKIISKELTTIWIDGKKFEAKEIDCKNYSRGTHRIGSNSSIEKFEIETPLNIKNEDCFGWNVDIKSNKWMPANTDLQNVGLIYNFPKETETSTIRNWISLFTEKKRNLDYSSTMLNAIKRAKYGI